MTTLSKEDVLAAIATADPAAALLELSEGNPDASGCECCVKCARVIDSIGSEGCTDCRDVVNCRDCHFVIQSTGCTNCYGSEESRSTSLFECEWCKDCSFCYRCKELVGARYMVMNVQVTKKDWTTLMGKLAIKTAAELLAAAAAQPTVTATAEV